GASQVHDELTRAHVPQARGDRPRRYDPAPVRAEASVRHRAEVAPPLPERPSRPRVPDPCVVVAACRYEQRAGIVERDGVHDVAMATQDEHLASGGAEAETRGR